MIAFSFLGIESVAVTAFEARSSKSLRLPSQSIAYVALVLYFLCLLGQLLNVSWDNDHLPQIYGGIGNDTQEREQPLPEPGSSSLTIIALWAWGANGHKALAGFLNAAMIFAVMSAGNTSLYIASRTLYGLARDVPRTTRLGKMANNFSHVVPSTGVPARALLLSAFAFIWLPFVSLKSGYAIQYVSHELNGTEYFQANEHPQLIEIVQISSSISCLIVWASLSFAYLRYYLWYYLSPERYMQHILNFAGSRVARIISLASNSRSSGEIRANTSPSQSWHLRNPCPQLFLLLDASSSLGSAALHGGVRRSRLRKSPSDTRLHFSLLFSSLCSKLSIDGCG